MSDYLGYNVYAQTLWTRIQAAINRDLSRPDKSLGDDPLVAGIFGEWGSGKSFLLQQVLGLAREEADRRIGEHQKQDTEPLTVPVYFQPWKYEHEKHLLVPLLLHIQAELQSTLQRAMPNYTRNRKWVEKNGNALVSHIDGLVDVFGLLMNASLAAFQLAQPQTMLLMPVAKTFASLLRGNREKSTSSSMAQFRFDDFGGRSYYEMHSILTAITRPNLGKVKQYLPESRVDQNFSINFVIFIDDLDRCLPEKSVAVLEIVKTIFNLESFAFVLALDDEVVERGIGHRYKDYALQNKKPEMPITGFEYLEKIIHLPLRLPSLSTDQSVDFLNRYELDVLQDRAQNIPETQRESWLRSRSWFTSRDVPTDDNALKHAPSAESIDARQVFHLSRMVVFSFDACAPRKLMRVVELWHHVLDVLEARDQASLAVHLRIGGSIDPRLLMTLVLLQLFQPELFRNLKRSRVGLDVLLKSSNVTPEQPNPLSSTMSNVDLMHWAVYFAGERPPVDWQDAMQRLPDLDVGSRGAAQRLRLPLVQLLLEHRSVQRHSFDPLKLLDAVRQSGAGAVSAPLPTDSFLYFSVLGAVRAQADSHASQSQALFTLEVTKDEDPAAIRPQAGSGKHPERDQEEGAPNHSPVGDQSSLMKYSIQRERRLNDPVAVFQTLISPEEADQRRVAEIAGLSEDEPLLHPQSSQMLRSLVEREFLNSHLAGEKATVSSERRRRLLRGLSYLAPYIPTEERSAWWELVKDVPHQPAPFTSLDQLHTYEQWADVRSTLGFDNDPAEGRFDPDNFFLLRERYPNNDETIEPIPGFVLLPPINTKSDTPKVYISRVLTTVSQFKLFCDSGGYSNQKFWEDSWALKEAQNWNQPVKWETQLPYLSRPVRGINWYEASAYARWLTFRFPEYKNELIRQQLSGAITFRPIRKDEWDRAAAQHWNDRLYIWALRYNGYIEIPSREALEEAKASGEAAPRLKDNLHDSGLGRCCVVGIFDSEPHGVSDLFGNVDDMANGEGNSVPRQNSGLKGGSWNQAALTISGFGLSSDELVTSRSLSTGFRLVMSLS